MFSSLWSEVIDLSSQVRGLKLILGSPCFCVPGSRAQGFKNQHRSFATPRCVAVRGCACGRFLKKQLATAALHHDCATPRLYMQGVAENCR